MTCRAAGMLFAVLALAACQRGPDAHHFSFFAFGTLVELTVVDADSDRAEAARHRAAERLDEWHRDWHAWEPGPLTRFNAELAAGGTPAVPESLRVLLPQARRLSLQSGGLFNPAIGRLVALWGFHADEAPAGPPPQPEAIEELVAAAPGMGDLKIEGGQARSTNPALELDFGAVAKGTALALLGEELAGMGLRHFLLNAGGDLVARGRHGGRPWRVGIRDPAGDGVLASLDVHDGEAVFTSGDYERYFSWQGERYHHIIDPRNGRPARGLRSVTVLTADAAQGDAAATALFVAGPGEWPAAARAMGIERAMAVPEQGPVMLTPAMAERVTFVAEPPPRTRVIAP